MSSIALEDLRQQPAKQWLQPESGEEVVVTSQGQPIAVLLPIDATSLEPTLSALRSVRALRAQVSLQAASAANGAGQLTESDIAAEIAAARRAR